MSDDIQFIVHPVLVGLSAVQLLARTSCISGTSVSSSYTEGIVFRIQSEDFFFGLEVFQDHLILERGEHGNNAAVPLLEPCDYTFFARWTPTVLELTVIDRFGTRSQSRPTAYTRPPPSVVAEARRRQLLPPKAPYCDRRQVIHDVLLQLQSIEPALAGGAWAAYWNGDQPKSETQAMDMIVAAIAATLEYVKGVQVLPEAESGAGRMDVLFLATLADGSPVKVCAEFKLAHSKDLAHGLESQLQDYMQEKGTDLGIYGVIDFGLPPVVQFNVPKDFPQDLPLEVSLQAAAAQMGVSSVLIRVLKPKSPSAR